MGKEDDITVICAQIHCFGKQPEKLQETQTNGIQYSKYKMFGK